MNNAAPVTTQRLAEMKAAGEKIAMLTVYDATFARAMCAAGVDVLLIGDSLGNVVQGHASTHPVSVDDMAYHTRAVARGSRRPLILADMPFASFGDGPSAFSNASRLIAAGAAMVKIEGAGPMVDVARYLVERGIPVCGHLGLVPQSVHLLGGYRVQGREESAARQLIEDAVSLQQAGAQLLVCEAIPSALAADVTDRLDIPVIGIGAGAGCDGQVLVMHDMLGLNPRPARFVRDFMATADDIESAFADYVAAVRSGAFPAEEHGYG